MTREQAIEKLRLEQKNTDLEARHMNADDVLCDLLIELGYSDVVDEFAKIDKFYA